jgi:hypothetical protein
MGQPLPGVDVIAATMDGMPFDIATSDADGKVAVTVPVRRGVLCRLALGPGPLRLGDPHATLGEDGVTWLDVAADPDRVVKLHVLHAASVSGATGAPFAVVELAELVRQGNNVGVKRCVRSTTDEAGRFDLQGLPGGSYRVIVHVGDQLTATADVEVAEGTAANIVKLDVPPTGTVTGVVTDAAGPVAGVWVLLLRGTTDRRGRLELQAEFQPVLTDRNGRYRMARVAPGDWLVQVLEQKPRAAVPVTVEEGRTAAKDLTAQR